MANIAYPNLEYFLPARFELGLQSNVFISTSPLNGNVQSVEMPGARWVMSMTYSDVQSADLRAEIEAFWAKVRGQANRVQLWHFRRPVPRGTLSGSISVQSTTSAMASSIPLAGGTNGQMLKAGDLFSVNSELKMVTADATVAGGVITVPFSPPLRAQATATTPITLTRPTANFLLTSPDVRVPYDGYIGTGFSVELTEVFP